MQLTEVSVTGVRSAVIMLQRLDTPIRVLLFPMIHLGTEAYYQAVFDRLAQCQVVLAEGIDDRSVLTRALTAAYRTPARSRRLGLVVQRVDYRALAALGVRVLIPDLTADQARTRWRAVPWWQRLLVIGLVPFFGLAFRLLGTRRVLARHLTTEDRPTLEDHEIRQVMPAMMELITDSRDRQLLETLSSILRDRAAEPVTVGVVYGAAHMVAVVRELARHGFRPRSAEWLTVFEF